MENRKVYNRVLKMAAKKPAPLVDLEAIFEKEDASQWLAGGIPFSQACCRHAARLIDDALRRANLVGE